VSSDLPPRPLSQAEGGRWGLEKKNVGPSRNGCVLGVRAAGPHPEGWNGGNRCQRWCCGAGLAALTFPPSPPFLSRAAGEEGGMVGAVPFAVVPCRFATGRGRGMVGPHRSPLSPVASGRGKVGAGEEERWPLTQWLRAGSACRWPAS